MHSAMWGLLVGALLGVCLYKANLLSYEEQVNAMIFKNMNLLKFYMSAQMTALVSLSALRILGLISVDHSMFNWFDAIIGGLVFGFGWGLLGYCPGSCSAAVGAGKIDGLFGLIGIICGAIISAFIFPIISIYSARFVVGDIGLSNPVWLFYGSCIIVLVYLIIFHLFEKNGL